MKKRLLSIVLALALALSLVPMGFAAQTQDTSIVNPAYTYLGAGVYDDVYILEATVPDDGTIWPYPFLNVTNVGGGGSNVMYDADAIEFFESGENKGKFSGVKPGEAQYTVDFHVGGTPGGENGTYCVANIRIYVIPAAEYYASHKRPADAIPSTGNTPGTNTNTGNNSNTSTNSVINPEFGRYLKTNEYGVYLFDITIPDDETPQPLPFFNISDFSAAGVDSRNIIGCIGLDNTEGNRGKLYGKTPGTGVYRVSVYVGGTPGAYDGAKYSAIVNVTVIPAAEYYGTGTTPGSGDTERPHAHRYADEITKRPTASQPGVRTYTCTICGDTYTEAIPATGIATGTPISKTTNSGPVKSRNVNNQNYSTWSNTVKSYLYRNESGGLTRVEYVDGKVVVEDYDSSFKLQSSWSTQPELPIWGGFYAGVDYNFLIFGQNNPDESSSKEVIRVVQYTKDWQRIKSTSLSNINTKEPFNFGSLRCTEYGDYLYIRTCRTMFKSGDGVNHQSNLMIAIRESDMTATEKDNGAGYVSHSFAQFLLVDQTKHIISLDQGDAYPRAAIMRQYTQPAGQDSLGTGRNVVTSTEIISFPGNIGDNATGCSVGGLEETSNGYVVAYSYDGVGGGGSSRDIYLSLTNKNLSSTNKTKLSTGVKVTTPQMVSTGLNGGYVLWNEQGGKGYSDAAVGGTLYYAPYDASGKAGTVKTATAPLSDCKPINYNGKIVWYATSNCEPVFYILDSSGITSVNTAPAKEENPGTNAQQPGTGKQTFSDVPAGAFFTEPVAWAVDKEVTNGTTSTTFSPYEECTQVQILTFLWRAAGKPASNTALPINITGKNIDYAEGALRWAAENKMIDRSFVPNTPCTRASAVTYIWQAFGSPEEVVWSAADGWGGSNFTDVPANSTLADAISWAVAEEVTNGTSKTTFSPNDICNRGQIVTFLYRAYH